LGARGKNWLNLKDDFVLFAGLFLYLKGNFLMDTGALILTSNLFKGINPAFVIQAGYISK